MAEAAADVLIDTIRDGGLRARKILDPVLQWQPWAMMAFTRALNSLLVMKSRRTVSRDLALVASWLIQNCTPAKSPPRRRNAL
jgi:hypothetical protein